jgi:hypothetical protein
MRILKNNFILLVFALALMLVSLSSGQAWNLYDGFIMNPKPSPWSYVFQSGPAFNGTYIFTSMIPSGGEMNIPLGWKTSNSTQSGIWQENGRVVMNNSQADGADATQGFIKFTAPASGTYRINGSAKLRNGVAGTNCISWIRSDLAGTLWSHEISEQETAKFDITTELKSGQTLIFGQDALSDSGHNNTSGLYWNIDCNILSKHSVSGLEKWDAYKDFCNTAQGHRNWRYLYDIVSKWNVETGTDMMASILDRDWWISANNPSDSKEIMCGAKAEKGRIILVGSSLALPKMRWNAPHNGYYRIRGDAYLESSGSAQLSVSMIDNDTPGLLNVSPKTGSKPYKFNTRVLLNKGDSVIFGIYKILSDSGSYDQVKSSWNVQIEQVAFVPSPWKPLTHKGNAVSCWGRTYDFGSNLMPKSITANRTNLLSSGIRFDATVGTTAEAFRNVEYSTDEFNSEYAVITTIGYSSSLKATCKWRFEYDGMLLCDLYLEPRKQAVEIAKFDLVIPFNPSIAKLFHNFPYASYNTIPLNCGAITPIDFISRETNHDGSMTFPGFFHGIWIGDEKRGLQWFAESDEVLNPLSPFASISSSKSLKLSLLESKTISSSTPFKFTFGFQASPVKPTLPADKPRYGMWSALTNCWNHDLKGKTVTSDKSWLYNLASMGMDCMHPWSSADEAKPYAGDPYNTSKNSADYQMDKLVESGRRYGMAIMANCGVYIEDIQPGTDWANWGVMPYTNWGFEGLHYICQRSGWKDWFIDQARKALRDSLADGFYCDGNGIPWQCNSPFHGCGYLSGTTRKSTVAILDTRDTMKQLYLLCRDTGKKTCIVHHMSGTVLLPALSFADACVEGEHLQMSYPEDSPELNTSVKLGDGNNPYYRLPAYRAEMTGFQFGTPTFVLRGATKGYEAECSWRTAAYSFIHGRMPLGGIGTDHSYAADAWRFFTEFGGPKAELIGYWEPSRPVISNLDPVDIDSTDGIKITAFKRKGIGALCVVANMRQPKTRDEKNNPTSSLAVTLKVDRTALGLGNANIQVKSLIGKPKDLTKTGSETFTTTIIDGQYQWLQIYIPTRADVKPFRP